MQTMDWPDSVTTARRVTIAPSPAGAHTLEGIERPAWPGRSKPEGRKGPPGNHVVLMVPQ